MSEIPMPSGGGGGTAGSMSSKTFQVQIAILLLVINALLGVVAAVVGLVVWENALSAFGLLIALFALWVAKALMDGKPEAWLWAVIVNIIAIGLYATSFFAIEGIILCLLTLIYLNIPDVKAHFGQ
ncbi:MAG: hypothetical protein RTU30_04525 [Candidatus Thorarchaeota archaeon]